MRTDDHRLESHRTCPRPASLAAACAVAALACLCGPTRADAQFGFGGGYGFFNFQPPEVGFLNQHALQVGGRATMGPSGDVYANRPNSYMNQMNNNRIDSYDPATRVAMSQSMGRFVDAVDIQRNNAAIMAARPAPAPRPPTPVAVAEAAPPAPPQLPIASFFDRYDKLVWPDSSPTNGDLGAKRDAAGLACLGVLNEAKLRGLAQVSTVTDARSKLIDYGRPALAYIEANSTPRIADTFHLFLMSLYESLAQAATIPTTRSNGTPATP